MEMATCYVCAKIFGTSSGTVTVCPSCRKLLDIVYEKARAYLRDHPKDKLNAMELAKALGEDERHIELLMLEGRFDAGNNGGIEESQVDKMRKKLLEDLQRNLASPSKKDDGEGMTTYGADRYGKDRSGTGRGR